MEGLIIQENKSHQLTALPIQDNPHKDLQKCRIFFYLIPLVVYRWLVYLKKHGQLVHLVKAKINSLEDHNFDNQPLMLNNRVTIHKHSLIYFYLSSCIAYG